MTTATSDTEVVTDAVIILFIMDIDEQVFQLLQVNGSSLTNKLQNKSSNEDSEDQTPTLARPAKEGEEEKVEEQVEEANFSEQDYLTRKVSFLTMKNSELNERLESLEANMQGNCWQDTKQNGEGQAADDGLPLQSEEIPRLQQQIETLSHTVVRMEFEIKLLKVTQEENPRASAHGNS